MTGNPSRLWTPESGWSHCPQPLRSELDQLTAAWISGEASPGDVAIRLWEFWAEERFIYDTARRRLKMSHSDAKTAIEAFADAVVDARSLDNATVEERKTLLRDATTAPDSPQVRR